MTDTRHPLLCEGEIPCRSCPHDFPMPATHIAKPKLKDGGQGNDWPLCGGHLPYAMCAGWFPIREITEEQS